MNFHAHSGERSSHFLEPVGGVSEKRLCVRPEMWGLEEDRVEPATQSQGQIQTETALLSLLGEFFRATHTINLFITQKG